MKQVTLEEAQLLFDLGAQVSWDYTYGKARATIARARPGKYAEDAGLYWFVEEETE